jgi:hypothetical protein
MPVQLIHKWSAGVLSEGFVPFPKKLLRCAPRLFEGPDSVKDLAVVLSIVDFNRDKLWRQPSLAFLSFVAGLSEEDVMASLDRLEQKSFIRVSGDFITGLNIQIDGLLAIIESQTQEPPSETTPQTDIPEGK